MNNKTNDTYSLSHTTWKCQYHIVFAPKYRRKVIYPNCNNKLSIFRVRTFWIFFWREPQATRRGKSGSLANSEPLSVIIVRKTFPNLSPSSFLTRSNTEITESADLSGKHCLYQCANL